MLRLLVVELARPANRLHSREVTFESMSRFFAASISRNEARLVTTRLFGSFLDDSDQYRACEKYWETLVSSVADSVGQGGEWPRWISRQYADGTPMEFDGNPMFDGRSSRLNRAFRVIQHHPAGDAVEVVAWLQAYEEEFTELPAHELVINLCLTKESAEIVRVLLSKWMLPETTIDEMKGFLSENLPRSDQ